MSDTPTRDVSRRRFIGRAAAMAGLSVPFLGCEPRTPKAPPATPTPPPAPPTSTPPPTSTTASVATSLPDGRDPLDFTQHGKQPWTLESRPERFGLAPITPNTKFFVRNNLPMPDPKILEDRGAWTVSVEGVARPQKISVDELMRMPAETVTAVIQCSGNGRAFFQHGPSGSQWATGAAGCATWTGVRVRDVVQAMGGATAGLPFMTTTGGDPMPAGVDRDTVVVERSIPTKKGLLDSILAWEMNGVPIPLSNGGPLRLIVPGYFGVNNIKYVKRLAFTAAETTAKIQKSGYRFRSIGQKGAPTHPSMLRMPVKSWFIGPGSAGEPILAGARQVVGVALSGERGVARVEYSLDFGQTWKAAEFISPDLGPSAWRLFRVPIAFAVGAHKVLSRAFDTTGEGQPQRRAENERGYANNSWSDHAITLNIVDTLPRAVATAEPAPTRAKGPAKGPAKLSEAGKRGKALVQTAAEPACGVCHTIDDLGASGVVGPNLDELRPTEAQVVAAVTQGVGAMPGYKGKLTPTQIADIARYIVETTGR